ncbi:choice-of-anchor D domain-containing protein [Vitiosangium sp. GDMCC 1.1324]|uniref:choice-of-anchor D domain-containing protein n=1 Tax=Vitiosangium sp. (strain GDMCC 1.1324) TaxID=2138576 RepID=UPI00130E4A39|nr:choice-of-anchor D domain-containing protein [Vitiosangium sp. GDMCC 1.1324]
MFKRVFFRGWVLGLVVLAGCGGSSSGTDPRDGNGDGVIDDRGTDTRGDAGSSEGAAVEVSDASGFNYGSTLIGTTAEHRFFLHNRGTGTAKPLEVTLTGASFSFVGGTFPGVGGTCGSELAAGASCQVAVAFTPSERASVSGTLKVQAGNGLVDGDIVRTLAGKGIAPALVVVEPASVDFGVVSRASSAWRTVTLTNTGDVDALQLSARTPPAPFSFKGGYQPGTGGTCWITLAAGESCTLVLGFSPGEEGLAKTTLSLSYEDGVSFRSMPLVLSGSGRPPAKLSISGPEPFDFGAVAIGTVAEHTFTVTNTGGEDAININGRSGLDEPYAFKGGSFPGTGGTCATRLGVGASCTMVVTFAPARADSFGAYITLLYMDAAGGMVSAYRELTGTGVSPLELR